MYSEHGLNLLYRSTYILDQLNAWLTRFVTEQFIFNVGLGNLICLKEFPKLGKWIAFKLILTAYPNVTRKNPSYFYEDNFDTIKSVFPYISYNVYDNMCL